MKLMDLLERLEYECVSGSVDAEVNGIANDSRHVEEGFLFFCIRGAVVDGHKYVPEVVEKGVRVLVTEEAVPVPEGVTVIKVKDSRYAMAVISAAWFGNRNLTSSTIILFACSRTV